MSIRKVSLVRQSLVKKGYIHCTYETGENGKEYSAAIVTIIDIWEENNKRFSKADTPAQDAKGIAPHANPRVHVMPTPLAPHANKEELINKNQLNKEKDNAALPQTVEAVKPKPTQSNPYYDAIVSVLDIHGGQNADIQKMLAGTSKKKGYLEYNMTPPVSLEEFLLWGKWAKKEHGDYMIKAPAKVNGSIARFRAKQNASPKLAAVADVVYQNNNLATDGIVVFEKAK